MGDPAYPLKLYCIKEYTQCINNEQVILNILLRGARNVSLVDTKGKIGQKMLLLCRRKYLFLFTFALYSIIFMKLKTLALTKIW